MPRRRCCAQVSLVQSLLQTSTAPLQIAEAQGEARDAEVVQVSLADVEVATVDAFQVCTQAALEQHT